MVSARARRKLAGFARKRGLSWRRSCALFSVPRSTLRYESRLDVKDAPLLSKMGELASENPRYGYRRIHALLRREGLRMSPRKAHRLWRKAGLQVPKRRRRRVPQSKKPRPAPSDGPNQVWAYDFVHDMCANGQPLKCLTVVDEFTREALSIEVAGSFRSQHVVATLARLVSSHGAPRYLRSDNGSEFICHAVKEWLANEGIETVHNAPGKPWQNGLNESFNGKFRDECLNAEWFPTRREARVVIETFRKKYNNHRPHSSLGYQTPNEFKKLLNNPQPAVVL